MTIERTTYGVTVQPGCFNLLVIFFLFVVAILVGVVL